MTSQSNQITPSSQSVVRFEDQVVINMLGSHSTFEVNNLLEIIPKECLDINKSSLQFRVELANLVDEIPEKGSSKQQGKVGLSLVLQPQGIALVGDDTVISYTGNSTNNIAKKLTFFSPDYFIKTIEPHVGNDIYPWLRKSFECRVLVPGEDWQHGRIKLSLVFYPDKAIDNEAAFSKSSLDEIRKTIVESSEQWIK